MNKDRKMLVLAAKAAGYKVNSALMEQRAVASPDAVALALSEPGNTWWNPFDDDGDALRLAIALGLVIDCSRPSAGEPFKQHHIWLDELAGNEALTRWAIVSAASEIGANMP